LYIPFEEFIRSYGQYVSENSIDSFYLFLIANPPEIEAVESANKNKK
jgi:hypothetical protein